MARSRRKPKSGRDLKRRPAFRSEPDRVLIVTEGSKTEPAYFRMLIVELDLTTAKVTIVSDGGSAPISVIQETEKRLIQDGDFEQVYCIFDRDRHDSYEQALENFRTLAQTPQLEGKTVHAITSIPCFEMWYKLHVSDSRKPYTSAQELIADLKKFDLFSGYDKKDCAGFYEKIALAREEAAKRAVRFLDEARKDGSAEFDENPSTRVHLVVEALTEIARKRNGEQR